MQTFKVDFRTGNPGLHDLYVGYAYGTITTVDRAVKELEDHSRVHSSLIAGAMRRELHEAAALYFAGLEPAQSKPVEETRITAEALNMKKLVSVHSKTKPKEK